MGIYMCKRERETERESKISEIPYQDSSKNYFQYFFSLGKKDSDKINIGENESRTNGKYPH